MHLARQKAGIERIAQILEQQKSVIGIAGQDALRGKPALAQGLRKTGKCDKVGARHPSLRGTAEAGSDTHLTLPTT